MMSFSLPKEDLWQRMAADPRPKVIYGMGDGGDKLISRLEAKGIPYADVFASDGFVRGQCFHGKKVLSFKEVEERYGDFIVLVSFATRLPEVIENIAQIAARHPLFVPDMPVYGEAYFDLPFCESHIAEIKEAAELWADERSKEVYLSGILGKLTGELSPLLSSADSFRAGFSLLPLDSFETTVDAGAYRGDTATELLTLAPNVKKIIAIEPDDHSFVRLVRYAEEEHRAQIIPYKGAAWSDSAVLSFLGKGNRGSHAKMKGEVRTVSGIPIDELCADETIDYIKFDVEGAEAQALAGAKNTILRDRPAILLSLYHKAEDLFALPLQLKALCPDYDFYLRREFCLPLWEVNLLAVPKEKNRLKV